LLCLFWIRIWFFAEVVLDPTSYLKLPIITRITGAHQPLHQAFFH
jgi:hypothetical protein